jgi:S-disulfanyl-L-cysteine oxidoreductase SoxD
VTLRTLLLLLAAAALFAQASRSVKDGVYTAAQADKGKAIYADQCASCHGEDLLGSGPFPALVGDDFQKEWRGQTVNDLFERMKSTMPATKPGSLSAQQNADLLAYLFKENGYPAGKTDVPADAPSQKALHF